jgi:predicted O-methyltransferase YrrM
MKIGKFLDLICKDKPAFLKDNWVQGITARHLFMYSTIGNYIEASKYNNNNFNLVEIGTWMGSSMLTWAHALRTYNNATGNIVCIDPLIPYLTDNAVPIDSEHQEFYNEMQALLEENYVYEIWNHHRKLVPNSINVSLFREKSSNALPILESNKFDVVYIDGSHSYSSVLDDINQAARITREGGIICGDDLELQLHQCDQEFAINNKNSDYIIEPKNNMFYHPGVTLAVGEYFGEVSSYAGFWVARKKNDGFTQFDLAKIDYYVPEHFSGKVKENYIKVIKPMFDN